MVRYNSNTIKDNLVLRDDRVNNFTNSYRKQDWIKLLLAVETVNNFQKFQC